MLDCGKTVTLVRHLSLAGGDEYQCTVIPGCCWRETDRADLGSGGETPASAYTVQIPEESVPEDLPQPGDYMALGVLEAVTSRRDLDALPNFRVAQVVDNRRGVFLRHVKVVGA